LVVSKHLCATRGLEGRENNGTTSFGGGAAAAPPQLNGLSWLSLVCLIGVSIWARLIPNQILHILGCQNTLQQWIFRIFEQNASVKPGSPANLLKRDGSTATVDHEG